MIFKTNRYILKRMPWDKDRIILSSPDILSERHLPQEIVSRDRQLEEIGTCLSPITEGKKPVNCWLYGKPGTGKTSTARWILKRMASRAGVRDVYVNCWENPTFFSVLECIARELRMLGAEKLSTSFRLERLKRHVSGDRLVIVLDEIDQVPPKERNAVLYNLSDLPAAGLFCISNACHIYHELEERVKSRLNPARIRFDAYEPNEMLILVLRRAQRALIPDTYTDDVLKEITDLANGDARIAIQTLKNASYLAEKEHAEGILARHVRRAWHSAKNNGKSFLLRRLTDHHRLLYELISKKPGILSGDLWRLYLKTCESRYREPIAERTYSEYCNKLADIGLVRAKRAAIKGKVREFSAVS